MKKLLVILLLTISSILYSQCDSLRTELDIEKDNNKITVNFLSEKLYESDIQNDKLNCQLLEVRFEVMKQKTLKWISLIGGGYISGMTFLIYIRK